MKSLLNLRLLVGALTLAAWCGASAQSSPPAATPAPPPSAPAKLSATELEKLVAPIALYPDALLATILPASVYPLEIVQAARFVADTNNLAKLDKPIDRAEWGMTPQTVNAYHQPFQNEIVFPAAYLQPPNFNMDADPAVNYGAIGYVIGHESGHAFDDKGRACGP